MKRHKFKENNINQKKKEKKNPKKLRVKSVL